MRNLFNNFVKKSNAAMRAFGGVLSISKNIRALQAKAVKRSHLVNIFHCSTHKSGSQWIKAIFNDDIVFTYSGLEQYTYSDYLPNKIDGRKITERVFDHPFPKNKIVSPLYITYDSYTKIPKVGHYKTIYITRDPRDLLVSYYFSMKFSHTTRGKVIARREKLIEMDLTDGLISCMHMLIDNGTFDVQRSWIQANDDTVMLVRYEDLIGKHSMNFFRSIFNHCEINLPENTLIKLIEKYRFQTMSSGRTPGQENQMSHYRKGITGDWKNYFPVRVKDTFKEKTGDLLIILGYEKNILW